MRITLSFRRCLRYPLSSQSSTLCLVIIIIYTSNIRKYLTIIRTLSKCISIYNFIIFERENANRRNSRWKIMWVGANSARFAFAFIAITARHGAGAAITGIGYSAIGVETHLGIMSNARGKILYLSIGAGSGGSCVCSEKRAVAAVAKSADWLSGSFA